MKFHKSRIQKQISLFFPTVPLLLLLLFRVPSAKCDLNFKGEQALGLINSVFELPLRIFDMIVQKATSIGAIVKGQEPISTMELIATQGYRQETHEVITEDGYILELHRIPHERPPSPSPQNDSLKSETVRPPVLLFHGIAQSSADWVMNSPKDDALGFHLADKGFDVWLANQRGTPYSTKHVSMDPATSQFWDFCTHEIGVFDLPAIVDYVLKETQQERLNFVGFSKGNAAFLIMNAKRPEYNQKVGVAVFLAPAFVYYDGFYHGKTRFGAPLLLKVLETMRGVFGTVPIIPPFITKLLHWIVPSVCHPKVDLFGLCMTVFKVQLGDDHGLITQEKLAFAQSITPVPVTLRTAIHITQQINFGEFTEYDFGHDRNLELYERSKPPRYNLTNVRVPVSIMTGSADIIGTGMDAKTLAQNLPNAIELQEINYPYFTHSDFCYATGAGELVYSKVVPILEKYS